MSKQAIDLVSVNGYLHPVSSRDARALVALGYQGYRIVEAVLPTLLATSFRGKLTRDDIAIHTWPNVLSDLLAHWAEQTDSAVVHFEANPITPRIALGDGVLAFVETGAHGHVHVERFETLVSQLRHYVGRYGHSVLVEHQDKNNGRLYKIRLQHSPDLPFVTFYSDLTDPVSTTSVTLSPQLRIDASVEMLAGHRVLRVKMLERTGPQWFPFVDRTVHLGTVPRESLADLGQFLLALSAA